MQALDCYDPARGLDNELVWKLNTFLGDRDSPTNHLVGLVRGFAFFPYREQNLALNLFSTNDYC